MQKNRRLLTDRYLRSLPPARRGHRDEVFDARLPGFGIRISDTVDADPTRRGKAGRISFILYGRFAPGAAPARRTIGVYGEDAMRLEDARRIAGEWRSQIARGKAGKTPMSVTGPIKADLDRRMLRTLKAMARGRGEDHHAVDLPGWVNHDLRRVVRSGLSALRVPHNVAEAILAHRPPGIVGTYNLHEYEDEKAEALEAWAQRLATIVNPEPAKVPDKKIVPLRKRRR